MTTRYDAVIRSARTQLPPTFRNELGNWGDTRFGTIGVPGGIDPTKPFAATDLTLLKPEATRHDILALCRRAVEHGAYAVCVNSGRIAEAVDLLHGSSTRAICVVGFPLGAGLRRAIAAEARLARNAGAQEIDMVLPVGLLKDRDWREVRKTIEDVVAAAVVPVKVILETCLLTEEEIAATCLVSRLAKAAFVKTSTGFNAAGAKVEHVQLMRRAVGDAIGVKASGGVRRFAQARAMFEAGASRIGASNLEDEASAASSY